MMYSEAELMNLHITTGNVPVPVGLLKTWGIAVLTSHGYETPSLDIQILLTYCCKKSREYLAAHPEFCFSAEEAAHFHSCIKQRITGIPVAYITGTKNFWKYSFIVTPDVLIPKPDTEILVEQAAAILNDIICRKSPHETIRVADICTGSGCIAISLAGEIRHLCRLRHIALEFHAVDISEEALIIARKNNYAILGDTSPISFFRGDLTSPLPCPQYDMIVSNPPYIPTAVTGELLKDGRSEPRLAVDGGGDGMTVITRLIKESATRIAKGGNIMIETSEYETEKTSHLLSAAGFINVTVYKDFAMQNRVVGAVKT